ncbi:MAG: hypothetical protein WCB57_13625 [Pseudonocardiaceae bacterium]
MFLIERQKPTKKTGVRPLDSYLSGRFGNGACEVWLDPGTLYYHLRSYPFMFVYTHGYSYRCNDAATNTHHIRRTMIPSPKTEGRPLTITW